MPDNLMLIYTISYFVMFPENPFFLKKYLMDNQTYPFWFFRFGTTEDNLGAALCKKLHAIGWRVSHVAVVRNEVNIVHLLK